MVVVQWMESMYTSPRDSVGLSNGLDVGVRESEGVKGDLYISGMSNY